MRTTAILLLISIMSGLSARETQTVEIGSKIGNFQLPEISGENISLQSYSGKVVVLAFWSFKCPVSLAYTDRIETLHKKYGRKGVIVFGIASGANETIAEIRANLSNLGISIPVLFDSEGILAERLGATHTPGVFILDGGGVLRYRGALDNNKRVGENGRIAYADDAIESILAGRDILIRETKPFGCVIKRARS